MSLDHILLGALEEPQSGYQLKGWFDQVFSFFWNADQSQIYRTLGRLAANGLLSVSSEASLIGPDRRVYRTTDLGRAELARWLHSGPASAAQRTAIYAQLIFASSLPIEDARAFLTRFAQQSDRLVAALRTVPDDTAGPADSQEERRRRFFNRAALKLGLERALATQNVASALLREFESEFPEEDTDGNAS